MLTLGVHDGHTATACLFEDGEVIACISEERLNRIKEWTGFPTQKHHKLLERIIKLGSNEGDLVADFFCGAGTTLLSAEKLKRRWIGCDISEYSIYLTRKRILDYQNRAQKFYPFELLTNLDLDKTNIIESGFFQKEISMSRKK